MLDARSLDLARFAVAVAGLLLLAWDWIASHRATPAAHARRRDNALAVVGALAFAAWWNFGAFHHPRFVHNHEFAHYFLGAKYHRELGYTQLYRCIVLVEVRHDDRLPDGWVRNLETNALEPAGAAVRRAGDCRRRFVAERWDAFTADVLWFRERFSAARWRALTADHGYNATPAWTMVGAALASLGPASPPLVGALALIDPVLYLAMWAMVWWAFGWRVGCVALVWWGTNYPARYSYIGGAFLRADWLALLVAGTCLLRRGHRVLAGAALAWSGALRVFPGALLASAAVRALAFRHAPWREGTGGGARRVLVGALAAGAIVVLAANVLLTGRPFDASGWEGLAQNSRKHLAQASTNRVGLKTVMAFEAETRLARIAGQWDEQPWDVWHRARARVYSERRMLFWALVAAYLALLARAVRRVTEWEAVVLAAGIPVIAFELACYYYAFLLVFAFLWPGHRWVGAALAALAAASSIPALLWEHADDVYVAVSALCVLFVTGVTAALAFGRGAAAAASSADPPLAA